MKTTERAKGNTEEMSGLYAGARAGGNLGLAMFMTGRVLAGSTRRTPILNSQPP